MNDSARRPLDLPDDALDGLLSGSLPRQTAGTTIASRRKSSKKRSLSTRDGRYQRSKGRDRPISTRVREDVFQDVEALCLELDVPKTEFYELAMQHLVQRFRAGELKSLDDIDPQD